MTKTQSKSVALHLAKSLGMLLHADMGDDRETLELLGTLAAWVEKYEPATNLRGRLADLAPRAAEL